MWFRKAVCLAAIPGLLILALAVGGAAIHGDQDRNTTVAGQPEQSPPVRAEAAPAIAEGPAIEVKAAPAAPGAAERPPAAPAGSSPMERPRTLLPGTEPYGLRDDPFAAEPRYPGYQRLGPSQTEHDPAMAGLIDADAEMEDQTQSLVAQYRKAASDADRAELRAELEELCNKHFDVRQQRRQLEVARLEARLKQVRAAIEKRNEARDLIVRVRVSRLLGDIEWDDWDLPTGRMRPGRPLPLPPQYPSASPFGGGGKVPGVPSPAPWNPPAPARP